MEPYTWTARVGSKQEGAPVRAYVGREQFEVSGALNFDPARTGVSALEYLLAAVGSDLVCGFQSLAKKRRVPIDDIEATVVGELENPLVPLGVIGETGSPGIKRIQLRVFISTPAAQDEVETLWQEVCGRSPLAVTFAALVELTLSIKCA